MSEHKYNDAYSKRFEAGKKQAFTGYCMQCYDEQVKLMVELGADIPNILDKISDKINSLRKVCDGHKVYVAINDVFDIIDKYKSESEG